MTAATLAAGTRSRHAGAVIALGHAAIEVPLMLLIVAGAGTVFQHPPVKMGIGLAGGAFLVFMGIQLLAAALKAANSQQIADHRHPFMTGVLLTAANPYFLIWWATIGLALTTQAVSFGAGVFVLFCIVHWLCDLIWLEALSFASYQGTELLGGRLQPIVLLFCGVMLCVFGVLFLRDAFQALSGLPS
jgi:threonine/homoserine/homoserine lactone efflux protein